MVDDAHGHAALLLVESLIHALVERAYLSVADAADIVETALDIQAEIVRETEAADSQAGASMRHAHRLLSAIWTTISRDIDGKAGSPQDAEKPVPTP